MVHGGKLYECERFPSGKLCSRTGYEPGTSKGAIAWKDITCNDLSYEANAVEAAAFSYKTNYSAGDKASFRGNDYVCLQNDYCNLENFHPALGEAGVWLHLINKKCPKAAAHIMVESSF